MFYRCLCLFVNRFYKLISRDIVKVNVNGQDTFLV